MSFLKEFRDRKGTGLRRGAHSSGRLLRLEPLEDRRLLAFTVNHTPYIQLGNAPLEGYNGGTDQAEILWQTTGTQETDAFTAEFRETGTLPWTNVALNADINTGVNDGPGVRINHSATFAALNFNDDYDYLITHLRGGSPIGTYQSTFHTRLNASDQSDFTFVTYGDSASGDPPTNFIAVQTRINAIDPAFSLLLGDNVYNTGTHAEYDLRLDPSKNAPLTTYNKDHIDYFAFGNHDVGYLSGQAARENYSMPIPVQGVTSPAPLVFDADVQAEENYSYDYGSAHFLTFDTNNWQNTAALNKQLDWAVADITAARARANPPNWVIVFGHHPITSLGGHTEHTPDDYYYDQVLSRLGHGPGGMAVDLLLAGHTHNYQRSYPLTGHTGSTATYVLDADNNYAKGAGIPLVIQGSGGVGLGYGANDATFSGKYLAKALDSNTSVAAQFGFGKVDVTPTTLTYSYINTLGQVLDSFTIGPPPPDTTPPTAAVSVPVDNGPTDQNPAANQVTVSTAQASFQIQLNDSGDGVDDATALASAISMTRNLVPLVDGVDYIFSYNGGTNVVTLTPLPPIGATFGDGSYVISLSAAIEDLASNPLVPTNISILVDTALPSVAVFQDGVAGYAGTKDTYVHEDEATTNHGALLKIVSDGDDDLGIGETQAQEVQGLVRFDNLFLSGGGASRIGGPIPDGATIISAFLRVRTGTTAGDESPATFNLHRMIATWDESVTWNSMTTSGVGIARDNIEASSTITDSKVLGAGGVNTLGALVTFDVTADLQLYSSNNALSTRGWLIHPDVVALGGNTIAGQTNGWYFDSSETATLANRPILEVTYVVAPTNVSAGGPYTIGEGSPINLVGSATGTGPLTYSWDVNGDDVFGDAAGATPTLSWAQLVALGINDGLTTRNVKVRVFDNYAHQVDSAIALLTVNNVAPSADASGPYSIDAGTGLNLVGVATDPVDALSYSWDVNGDGVFGDATGAAPSLSWAQLSLLGITSPNSYDVRLRADDGDGGVTDSLPVVLTISDPVVSTIDGRHIFYNQSVWDGNSAAISAVNDNAAIAPGKVPHLPGGGVAVAANITSFSRGINGIMVDLSAGVNHTGISATDFVFKVGNDNTPSGWAAAPAPSAISVIPGGGVGGADRVEITWASGVVKNQWLEVQVLATANTGLALPDVHFWGNKIGDSASTSPATTFETTTTDAAQVFGNIGAGKPITDLRDYNRDGAVTTTDAAVVFANIGNITRINIPGGGPFAPEAEPAVASDDGGSAVASALAVFGRFHEHANPSRAPADFAIAGTESARCGELNEHREHASTADRARALEIYREQGHDLNLDDELLDTLLEVVGIRAATKLRDFVRR